MLPEVADADDGDAKAHHTSAAKYTKDSKDAKDSKKETKPDAAAPPRSAPAKSEGSS